MQDLGDWLPLLPSDARSLNQLAVAADGKDEFLEIKREELFTTTYKAYQETVEYNPR